jgi:hypothetical protein
MENLVILIEYPRTNRLTALHGHFRRFINEVPVKSILYGVFHGKVHSFPLTKHFSTNFSIKQLNSIH